jgi:hypothetical protein
MSTETKRYPWRPVELLLNRGRQGAEEFAEDMQYCKKQCFIDDIARAHWRAHPSIEQLAGLQSRAQVLAMAVVVTDNIAHIRNSIQHLKEKASSANRPTR